MSDDAQFISPVSMKVTTSAGAQKDEIRAEGSVFVLRCSGIGPQRRSNRDNESACGAIHGMKNECKYEKNLDLHRT